MDVRHGSIQPRDYRAATKQNHTEYEIWYQSHHASRTIDNRCELYYRADSYVQCTVEKSDFNHDGGRETRLYVHFLFEYIQRRDMQTYATSPTMHTWWWTTQNTTVSGVNWFHDEDATNNRASLLDANLNRVRLYGLRKSIHTRIISLLATPRIWKSVHGVLSVPHHHMQWDDLWWFYISWKWGPKCVGWGIGMLAICSKRFWVAMKWFGWGTLTSSKRKVIYFHVYAEH